MSGNEKVLRRKIFNIMQYLKHPDTGEELISELVVKQGLEVLKAKEGMKYAYILHDKDINEDGTTKPPHYHIVLNFKNIVSITEIAKAFRLETQYVNAPRATKWRNAFLDCVNYLTHSDEKQQELGKYLYDDSEVVANFDWKTAIELEKNKKTNAEKAEILELWVAKVANGEMTLDDCRREDRVLFIKNQPLLERAHSDYLTKLKIPGLRINYYVYGGGGTGKGLMSRAIARSLYPNLTDDEIFFEVGSDRVIFDGYKGQPVIIWNDFRAGDLINALGGRGAVFETFDTIPTTRKQNIKYGSTKLLNSINIVNSVDNYETFLNGLAGEYTDKNGNFHESEDKNQSYRRFPIIIPINSDSFDILINKGFYQQNREFQQYIEMRDVGKSLRNFVTKYDDATYKRIENKVVSKVVEEHKAIENKYKNEKLSEITDEDLQAMNITRDEWNAQESFNFEAEKNNE